MTTKMTVAKARLFVLLRNELAAYLRIEGGEFQMISKANLVSPLILLPISRTEWYFLASCSSGEGPLPGVRGKEVSRK